MKITQIKVEAGRTFNHPYEQYSNFRLAVILDASISEGEDPSLATRELQAKAEKLAEDHKQNLLHSVRELHEMSDLAREVSDLERSLKNGQERLEEIRKNRPQAFQALPASTSDEN